MAVVYGKVLQPSITTTDLVGYWDAANSSSYSGSGTSWFDLSGNNNTATLINSPSYNSSGYFIFNGSTQYAEVAHNNNLNPTLSMTISVWVRPYTLSGLVTPFIGKGLEISGSGGFDFRYDVTEEFNLVKYFIVDQKVKYGISPYTWYNFVAVQSSEKIDYYVNANLVGTFSNSSNYQTNTANLRIARNRSSNYFSGEMSHIMYYKTTLNKVQILQNFNAVRTRYSI